MFLHDTEDLPDYLDKLIEARKGLYEITGQPYKLSNHISTAKLVKQGVEQAKSDKQRIQRLQEQINRQKKELRALRGRDK